MVSNDKKPGIYVMKNSEKKKTLSEKIIQKCKENFSAPQYTVKVDDEGENGSADKLTAKGDM